MRNKSGGAAVSQMAIPAVAAKATPANPTASFDIKRIASLRQLPTAQSAKPPPIKSPADQQVASSSPPPVAHAGPVMSL
jgi:hypothetical protein